MPNFDEAEAVIDAWENRLTTEPGLDVAAAAEELRALDPVFAARRHRPRGPSLPEPNPPAPTLPTGDGLDLRLT